jgi:hypothetical protein
VFYYLTTVRQLETINYKLSPVPLSFQPIKPLLQTGTNAASRWFSYIGLGIGVLLLLCSLQMFINIQDLMGRRNVKKQGFDFISVTKPVTNDNMGQPEKTQFTQQEMEAMRKNPLISGLAPLEANQFRVMISGGSLIPFKTDIFLESLQNDFIDSVPANFQWQEGELEVPIIVSTVFFEGYNVFAPTMDLPQLSKETASGIPLAIRCEGNGKEITFRSRIVGFSDRVNSILVPQNFLKWANQTFAGDRNPAPNRVYVKTPDANHPDFLNFIDSKNYMVNREMVKLGRTKQTLQGIFSGLGIFGVMIVIMALMLFSFYLQLVIARSRDSLQLLLTLGYSPKWLSTKVSRQFIPVYVLVVLAALALTQIIQFFFHHGVMFGREEISTPIHWSVVLVAVLLIFLSVFANYRLVKKLVYRLY